MSPAAMRSTPAPEDNAPSPQASSQIPTALEARLREVVGAGTLLVALDFDGVLAPLVQDPADSRILPGSAEQLRRLDAHSGVAVALVSGRGASELADLADAPEGTWLYGSHGAERGRLTGVGTSRAIEIETPDLTEEQTALRRQILNETEALTNEVDGAWVELKPTGVAVHTRLSEAADAERLGNAVMTGPATHDGLTVREGKAVIELSVVHASKGEAVEELRSRHRPDVTLFAGDDVTDEDGFATLRADDIGIKVGDGPTRARYRVADPAAFTAVLKLVADLSSTPS